MTHTTSTQRKQFVSFFCVCESFSFQQEQTCPKIFRCIGTRETKSSSLRSHECKKKKTRMPTWTTTQYRHQNTELEATLSVKTHVSKILKKNTMTATEAPSSGLLEVAVAS